MPGSVVRVELEPFWISRVPVTRAMFNRFATEGGYDNRDLWDAIGWDRRIPARLRPWPYTEMLDDPVTGVSLYDAAAFARWAHARIPAEHEWEVAAGWAADGRRTYPWGEDERDGVANVRTPSLEIGRTSPVGMYSTGDSALGLHDMGGNVWEWCGSRYRDYAAASNSHEGTTIHPLRGGCFWSHMSSCATTARLRRHAEYRLDVVGFRLAV
jgi:iron(II)-dependent oxidoreductase